MQIVWNWSENRLVIRFFEIEGLEFSSIKTPEGQKVKISSFFAEGRNPKIRVQIVWNWSENRLITRNFSFEGRELFSMKTPIETYRGIDL